MVLSRYDDISNGGAPIPGWFEISALLGETTVSLHFPTRLPAKIRLVSVCFNTVSTLEMLQSGFNPRGSSPIFVEADTLQRNHWSPFDSSSVRHIVTLLIECVWAPAGFSRPPTLGSVLRLFQSIYCSEACHGVRG